MPLPLFLLSLSLLWSQTPGAAAAPAAKCLSYGRSVELQGKLQRVTFAGPPNYESVAKGDRPEVTWVVDLSTRVCVEADEMNDAEKGVGTMQLVFAQGEKDYERFRVFIGRKVKITGKLFHAQTGHHHTSVLIEVTDIKQVG